MDPQARRENRNHQHGKDLLVNKGRNVKISSLYDFSNSSETPSSTGLKKQDKKTDLFLIEERESTRIYL